MQFYSFDLNDPLIEIDGWNFSFQLITLENVYSLDSRSLRVETTADGWVVTCAGLSWAGQQRRAPGAFRAVFMREGDRRLRLRIRAGAPHKIRAVKLLARGLPEIRVLDALFQPRDVPASGILDRYPNQLRLPLALAELPDGERVGFRCEDPTVRAKRFAACRERMGSLAGSYTFECIHEEDARHFATEIDVPDWIIERGVDARRFEDEQLAFAERALGLARWDEHDDMPGWARDIALCLTLHGMHWSGYTFNTYEQMLEIVRFAADRVPGRHILAYLPGWEGRYYWQAGDYRPEPALGGEEGFARLCDEARALGVHVMPMFAGTCANAWAWNFHEFGPSSYMKSPGRNVFLGNQPDWDISRSRDTGWQAWLNVGAPAWQNELVTQIGGLADRYGFDAAFLDCSEVWVNDPDFNLLEGYRQLVGRLREGRSHLLVTGEDWWDGLLGIFPMFQKSAYARPVPDWVGRYARIFGHIQDSEPSRGSTGVFESGFEPYQPLPDRLPYIPTIAFTDGTLAGAPEAVEAVFEQARRRIERVEQGE